MTYHFLQPHWEMTEEEAADMWVSGRLLSPDEVEEDAEALLKYAIKRQWPVTVGFWEVRKDETTGKPIKVRDPETGLLTPLRVHTVRTYEVYMIDRNQKTGQLYARAMDRCPRDRSKPGAPFGKPGIRSVILAEITDITIHKWCRYHYPNQHFIDRVKQHARDNGWTALPDTAEAIWHVIQRAESTDDAIDKAAAQFAGV